LLFEAKAQANAFCRSFAYLGFQFFELIINNHKRVDLVKM
jgi:hypothetical protein